MFFTLIVIVGIIAGIVASISGFGIGSLLTPLFNERMETKIAIAAVAIPHFFGTSLRLLLLRKKINYHVLWTFGFTSAIFGLIGALLHSYMHSKGLTIIFGVLLTFSGFTGVTGLAEKMELKGMWAWIAGAISGGFGGLVGNQGGIRSAAMLGLKVDKTEFIATATAIALFVDIVRIPIYAAGEWHNLWDNRYFILIAIAAVLTGTVAGHKILSSIPEKEFKRIVGLIILILGIWMISKTFKY